MTEPDIVTRLREADGGWTDAMVMCYPDDFQDEEDGK